MRQSVCKKQGEHSEKGNKIISNFKKNAQMMFEELNGCDNVNNDDKLNMKQKQNQIYLDGKVNQNQYIRKMDLVGINWMSSLDTNR